MRGFEQKPQASKNIGAQSACRNIFCHIFLCYWDECCVEISKVSFAFRVFALELKYSDFYSRWAHTNFTPFTNEWDQVYKACFVKERIKMTLEGSTQSKALTGEELWGRSGWLDRQMTPTGQRLFVCGPGVWLNYTHTAEKSICCSWIHTKKWQCRTFTAEFISNIKKRLLTQLPLFTDTGAPSTTATVSLFASVGQFYKHHQTHLETSFW